MVAQQTLTLYVWVRALDPQPKNSTSFDLSNFFIQAAVGVPRSELAELWGFPQAWHIITARNVVHIISPFGAVSHHALACIYLRLDDIQHSVLMISNSCGIDDIHAYGVILRLSSKPYYKTQKYLFRSLYKKPTSFGLSVFHSVLLFKYFLCPLQAFQSVDGRKVLKAHKACISRLIDGVDNHSVIVLTKPRLVPSGMSRSVKVSNIL